MGIISWVKGGVKEMAIARDDAHKENWVYKHPDKTIPMKSQLTVDADEVALFFRDGAYVGQFGPGRHTMDSSNIPFLGRLVDKFTGGNVFMAEVFFVNTREMASLKFGTTIGDIPDPQTGLRVRLMVHGDFSAKIYDPVKFVVGFVGLRLADNTAFTKWFKSQVQKTLKDDIAELIVKQDWPLLKVTSGAYTEELEEGAIEGVRKHVESYGVEIVRFGDFTINMDDKDKDRLDKLIEKAAYLNMTGGLDGYQKFAQAEMMINAGEGMAKGGGGGGGGALQGAGLGMGLGMAGMMMGQMQPGHPAQQQQAPAVATPVPSQMGSNLQTCGACNAKVAPGKFCAECGKPLAAPGPKFCSNCGKPLSGKFCADCGTAAPA
jgi:membrane protease subunit (stomatin/prohibitin family)